MRRYEKNGSCLCFATFFLPRSFLVEFFSSCVESSKGAECLNFSFFFSMRALKQTSKWHSDRLKWKYFESIKLRIKFMDTTRFRFPIAVHVFNDKNLSDRNGDDGKNQIKIDGKMFYIGFYSILMWAFIRFLSLFSVLLRFNEYITKNQVSTNVWADELRFKVKQVLGSLFTIHQTQILRLQKA